MFLRCEQIVSVQIKRESIRTGWQCFLFTSWWILSVEMRFAAVGWLQLIPQKQGYYNGLTHFYVPGILPRG